MKIILFLFYETAKALVWVVRWVYYGKRTVANDRYRDLKGPCILVSNHPGTLMDPLNAAVLMRRRVNFLANASMFSTPFSNWFFSTFYCIKVERYKDTGGKPVNNKEAFEMATRHLTKGGCLYMAPEGGSELGRRLHKLKTGPARIALNTEAANGFQLGLVVLPIGLNYTDPAQFRGGLHSVMGEPLQVKDFKKEWEENEMKAVRKLTAALRERMETTLVDTANEEEELLLGQMETILQNENPLEGQAKFLRTKAVLQKIKEWQGARVDFYEGLRTAVGGYFQKLNEFQLEDVAVKGKKKVPFLLMSVAFPFFVIGYLLHFLPAFLTKKLSDKLASHRTWMPTYKVLGGLLVYPLVFWLQYWFLKKCLANFVETGVWLKWAYLATLILAGLVVEWWIGKWRLCKANQQFRAFAKRQPIEKEEVVSRREYLLRQVAETS